jgi:hypothetical protein
MTSEAATKRAIWLARVFAMLMLGLAFAGAPLAQTTTTVNVRNFEVLGVDGNKIVLRDERGTNEFTVPNDFRLTVDGKKMAVSDLKAGMKGTATVTTTTTVTPVVVTEIRHGLVLNVGPGSVLVLDKMDGQRKRFTQSQVNDRGFRIFKDGHPIVVTELTKGDEITATIVSQLPPEVVTEQQVDATLAQSQPNPASTPAAADSSSAGMASSSVAAQPTPPVATAPSDAAPSPPAPAESSGMGMAGYILIVVVIAAVLFFFARRRKNENPPR